LSNGVSDFEIIKQIITIIRKGELTKANFNFSINNIEYMLQKNIDLQTKTLQTNSDKISGEKLRSTTRRFVNETYSETKNSVDKETIYTIIRNWVPAKRHKTEEAYQTELRCILEYEYKYSVRENAGISHVDILVEDKIPIELKKKPSRGDFDRLSGQIKRHMEIYDNLIIVICQLDKRYLLNEYSSRFENEYPPNQLLWITK